MIEIKMPRLSDTMEEGAISTWRKHPGDTVAVGDVLVEIETDKAVMEYEAYQAGTLAEIARHTLKGEFRRIDPRSAEVIVLEFCFSTPRIIMQKWRASQITPTPLGLSTSARVSAT